jgi:hypothetical protein
VESYPETGRLRRFFEGESGYVELHHERDWFGVKFDYGRVTFVMV